MGELLLFRPGEGQERKNRPERGERAQILFFTGVRYQRAGPSTPQIEGDSSASPSDGGGGGRGRRKRRG